MNDCTLTLFCASILAPLSHRSATTSMQPLQAAVVNAEAPL